MSIEELLEDYHNNDYGRLDNPTNIEKLCEEIKRLQDMDKILRNENINLKLRINKAREYIENPRNEMSVNTYQELLEILDKVEED